MIRIVLVDDQELVRTGLRALAESEGDIAVVGEAADGRAGVSRVRELRPDVVLMDIRMPRLDGLAATREIVADPALAGVRVLILTTFDEDEHVFEAIRSGAAGRPGAPDRRPPARRAHRARARGAAAAGPRADERRDRPRALPQPRHRTHLREPAARQARRPGPRGADQSALRRGSTSSLNWVRNRSWSWPGPCTTRWFRPAST